MGTTVYYFSGTGNSLAVAKDLDYELKDAKIIQINKEIIGEPAEMLTGKVGIIFPVYYYGLPYIVQEFVERLEFDNDAYIFTVATCGGSVGPAVKQLNESLKKRGTQLSAAFKIQMPDNYQVLYGPPSIKKQQKLFKLEKQMVKQIAEKIKNAEKVKFNEKGGYFAKAFGNLLYRTFKPNDKDRNFWTDDKCSGCGICSKVCPVQNIYMNMGKPHWNHRCEHCLACMQWCPSKSIQYNKGTIGRPRYHHPDIKVQELFLEMEG